MIRNKEQVVFEIKDTSVKMLYNNQCIVFNTFNCSSRHKFNRFKTTLANSSKNRYDNINDIYRLARICEVRGTYGEKFVVHKNIAY